MLQLGDGSFKGGRRDPGELEAVLGRDGMQSGRMWVRRRGDRGERGVESARERERERERRVERVLRSGAAIDRACLVRGKLCVSPRVSPALCSLPPAAVRRDGGESWGRSKEKTKSVK